MEKILQYAIDNGASDIHIGSGCEAWIRTNGRITKGGYKVMPSEMDEFVMQYIPSILKEYKRIRDNGETNPVDAAFTYNGRRFRINVFRSVNGVNMAIRLLSDKIFTLNELNLPKALDKFTKIKNGLFLVVGTTGSGKSTTLASIINAINRDRTENIITIEQPIEYLHSSEMCRITQIEVGTHIRSFDEATRSALRQDPDIILVGEMRDLETIQNAITLAETGHTVYGTLHAKSVTDTIDRIVDVFPPESQEQIRVELGGVLKGILHQTLLAGTDGKPVPLVEMLAVDDTVASMIRSKQKSNAVRDYARTMTQIGNVHITDNAIWHIMNNRLELEDVKGYLSDADYAIVKSVIEQNTSRGGFYD